MYSNKFGRIFVVLWRGGDGGVQGIETVVAEAKVVLLVGFLLDLNCL